MSWLLHAQDHRSCVTPPVLHFPCTLGNLDYYFILGVGRAHCDVSLTSVPAETIALKCLVCLSVLENPFLLPFFPQAGHWWSLLFSLSTDSLAVLLIFWAYQCILFLTLTLHFRGQALFYFLSHKCRLNFQNFSGQNNVKTCKLHFRLPPLLGCVVNWNEQSWQCLRTFLFWLQNKASCALYTVFSLINTWNNLLAITLYFSSFFKDVCYITCFGLEILSISTAFSGDCNVFWFLY